MAFAVNLQVRPCHACPHCLANGGGVDFDQLLVVGQLAERRWDSNFLCHKSNLWVEV